MRGSGPYEGWTAKGEATPSPLTRDLTWAHRCPDCGMFYGIGARADLSPPCRECMRQRRDCLGLYGVHYVPREAAQ